MRRVRCAVPLPAARAQRGCRGRAGRAGAGRAVPPQEEAQPGAEPPRSRPEPRGSEVGSEHCPQAETGTWIVVLPWRTPMPA